MGRPSILDTWDEFVTEVPLSDSKSILVYRRKHGGREFVRFRTWNQHRMWGTWYPTKRGFVISRDDAESLGRAILTASLSEEWNEEPEWVGEYSPNKDSWYYDAGR